MRDLCKRGLDYHFFPIEVEEDTEIQSCKVKELKADLEKLKVCDTHLC